MNTIKPMSNEARFNTLIAVRDDDSFSMDFHIPADEWADMLDDIGPHLRTYILLERGGADGCRLHYVAGDYSSDSLSDHTAANQLILKAILNQHNQRVFWRCPDTERDIIGLDPKYRGVRKI